MLLPPLNLKAPHRYTDPEHGQTTLLVHPLVVTNQTKPTKQLANSCQKL